jgi:hypothetical protein
MQNDNELPDNHVQSDGQLTALGVLSLLDTTKAQRRTFAEQVLAEGNISPLLVHCQIKSMESLLKMFTDKKEGKDLNEQYMRYVVDEAQKHGKSFEYHNAGFQVKEAGHQYDYSQCGDADLLQKIDVYDAMGKAIKERQEFLRKVPAKGLETVTDQGEVVTLYPPACRSTTTVAVTLK